MCILYNNKAIKTMDECTHTRLVFANISTFLTTKIHVIQSLNASKDVFKSHQECAGIESLVVAGLGILQVGCVPRAVEHES
jgi:hypothetical protein